MRQRRPAESSSDDNDAASESDAPAEGSAGGGETDDSSDHDDEGSSESSGSDSSDDDASSGESDASSDAERGTGRRRQRNAAHVASWRVRMGDVAKGLELRVRAGRARLEDALGPRLRETLDSLRSDFRTSRKAAKRLWAQSRKDGAAEGAKRLPNRFKELPPATKRAMAKTIFLGMVALLVLNELAGGTTLAFFGSASSKFGNKRARAPHDLFDPRWKETRDMSWSDLKSLLHVHQHKISNSSSIKIKRLPGLDKPTYVQMSSKELVQIGRPAVRKKRPDEPRAVRTFGCLRDGCRGLAIEDLLDRGWQMRFRAAQKNDTYKNINYRVTVLMTDTTQLTHMKKLRPDLFKNIYHEYEKKCYLSAFDGGDAIGGNKGQQLRRKESFTRKFGCKYNELAISPASYRLYHKDECDDLLENEGHEITWLLKPETGSQGQGITFHTQVSQIKQKQPKFFPCRAKEWKATERYLVQEYLERPLLLKKSKFDVRVYMLIASSNPYLVFYHEGYLRRSLAVYNPLSKDRKVYLTNTHFQSMKSGFKLSEHIWSFQEFQHYLWEQGRTGGHYVDSVLNPYLKKVSLFIFHTARHKLIKRKGTFHIFGIDFMIDDDWHTWFIESNGYPGFTWSLNFDTRQMAEDYYNLGQQVHENPRFFMLMKPGDRYGGFEMIFSELEEERTQIVYNPCEEFRNNRGYSAPLKDANRRFAKFSGNKGRTDEITKYVARMRGGDRMGGSRAIRQTSLSKYLNQHGCLPNAVKIQPKTFSLDDRAQCKEFFEAEVGGTAPWVLKSSSPTAGDGDGLKIYANAGDLKEEFGACAEDAPSFQVQKFIRKRHLHLNKYWDLKVFVLVARTEPAMVFYHRGYVRSARVINPVGADLDASLEVEGDEDQAADDDENADDDAGVETEEKSPDDESDGANNEEGPTDPPAEQWDVDTVHSGATFELGKHVMSFEEYQRTMAMEGSVGFRYLDSVFDPYAFRIAETVFQAARPALENKTHTYQLTALNFVVQDNLALHFVGARNVEPEQALPNAENLQTFKQTFLEEFAGLVLELNDMPAAFARMRRGDSYGGWRLVVSEFEEHQRNLKHDPCESFRRNLNVSKGSLFKNAWLHDYKNKIHAGNKRELRRYIMRKWDSCKHRPTKELQASCIRNTISYRYKIYIEKEEIPYQDGYVDGYIRTLLSENKNTGS